MAQKTAKILVVLLAIAVGFYPSIYFLRDRTFGLLSSKSDELLANPLWNTVFYAHIILGGIALLIGWLQFDTKLRLRRPATHRAIGKTYMTSALASSLAGIGLGFFATGGIVPSAGFVSLGTVWFTTTLLAYLKIRERQVEQHRNLMIYSYAACFAAVTLRIWLPLLIAIFGNFIVAYSIVAWLCWVPNLMVANLIVRKLKPYQVQ